MENDTAIDIRLCARPITLVHEIKPDRAVVCLHGYAGYPGELALPAKRLYSHGFDVFVPRYPGHGTNGEDFMKTGRGDWIEEAERVLLEALSTYHSVSLVGHSMGGAIAVILAMRHPVDRVVLYAPALSIPALPFKLVSLLSVFMKRRAQPWQSDSRYPFFDERDESDDAFLGKEYWSWQYFKQLRQLGLIQREAVSALSQTSADILVLTGEKDAVVDKHAGKIVVELGSGKNNWVHLPLATHLIPYDIDENTREEAMQRTISWLF